MIPCPCPYAVLPVTDSCRAVCCTCTSAFECCSATARSVGKMRPQQVSYPWGLVLAGMTLRAASCVQGRTKLCSHVGCSYRPTHNFPSQMPIVCEHHASAGMSDVQKRLCIHTGA